MSEDQENLNEPEAPPPAILPMPPAPQVVYVQQAPANALATTALILGIVGVVLFWTFWFGIILGILAIIFGAIGLSRGEEWSPEQRHGGRRTRARDRQRRARCAVHRGDLLAR